MANRFWQQCVVFFGTLAFLGSAWAENLTIFAAASMTDVLQQIGEAYKKQSPHTEITFSFAGSSTLAKQIEQDAPADLFISADQKWMQYLQNKLPQKIGKITPLVENELVLIAPKESGLTVKNLSDFDWRQALGNSYLAIGDDHVPVGRYAKKALTALNAWEKVAERLSKAKDVRAVLTYIERGELPLGIVYSTDAKISTKVKTVAVFPKESYGQILYPAATLNDKAEAKRFLAFLSSPPAKIIFQQAGFKPLAD